MKQKISALFFLSVFLLLAMLQCKPKEEVLTTNPKKLLSFSTDTVAFDTVFTNKLTVTKRFRVYNNNENAIKIKSIKLATPNTPFKFYANGRFGPLEVKDLTLTGKDSIYVLISAQIDSENKDNPFIIKDSILFEVEGIGEKQHVLLTAWGQDARYYNDSILSCTNNEIVWDSTRPYYIENSIKVPFGCTLTIKEGTKIYSYKNSFILVQGTLRAQGTVKNPILFMGHRRESDYENTPNQWGGIVLLDNSSGGAFMDYTIIKNSFRGIQVGLPGFDVSKPLARLNSCMIRNCADAGILSLTGGVFMTNCIVSDCAEFLFAGLQGGDYEAWHCTFAYSGIQNFQRQNPAVAFSDYFDDNSTNPVTRRTSDLNIRLVNSVILGGQKEEFGFGEKQQQTKWDTIFSGNFVKTKRKIMPEYTNFNTTTDYRFPGGFKYDFKPDTLNDLRLLKQVAVPPRAINSFYPLVLGGKQDILNDLRFDYFRIPRVLLADSLNSIGAIQAKKK